MSKLKRKMAQLEDLSKKGLTNEIGKTASLSSARIKKTLASTPFKHSRGGLKQATNFGKSGDSAYIETSKHYAPYIEFGLGKDVNLNDMLQLGIPPSYAMQFKGRGIKEIDRAAKPFFFPSIRVEYRKPVSYTHLTLPTIPLV